MIDKATVQKIMDAADIVDVVSDYVHLVRRGRNFMGLCPFHNERTPSFSVNKQRNFCYCFSCHKGGSPVNFLMEKEGINYHDALLQLAKRYGIKVEEKELTDEERARLSMRETMFTANEWAMKVMHENMLDTDDGRDIGLEYFSHRGVTDEAVKAFKLGYATDKGTWLLQCAKRDGYDVKILQKLGLIGVSQDGREYDRFRGRVIYPVHNSSGKVVAFGGRDIKGVSPAKYVNSPESEIYCKSNELYGIYQAKNSIVRENRCFLVEGYMDVIGMWQSGMQNVVASSGTALTDAQIALIHRFTNRVVLIYDGDAAGIKAALRGIEMLLSNKMEVKVLLLPDGDDPDSFARKHTPDEFRQYVEDNAKDVVSFMVQVLMPTGNEDPARRSAAIRSIIKAIAHIQDNIERNVYIQRCSELLAVPEDLVARETAKERRILVEGWRKEREHARIDREEGAENRQPTPSPLTPTAAVPEKSPKPKDNRLDSLEKEVIRYLIRYGMMEFCEVLDDDNNSSPMSVYEYVTWEMTEDNLTFSNPVYDKIYEIVGEIAEEFKSDLPRQIEVIEKGIEKLRREGFDAIAARDLDQIGIKREEDKLEENLKKQYKEDLEAFAIDYPARKLLSHEDDAIRHVATELLVQKHILSKYHYKSGMVEEESDRLDRLVPIAINEWKMGIVSKQLDDAIATLKNIQAEADSESVRNLQMRINRLHGLMRSLTQTVGDRIISPRKITR